MRWLPLALTARIPGGKVLDCMKLALIELPARSVHLGGAGWPTTIRPWCRLYGGNPAGATRPHSVSMAEATSSQSGCGWSKLAGMGVSRIPDGYMKT